MASAHKIVFVLLLLTASSASMLQARTMAPSDRHRQHAQTDHQAAAHAKERETLPSPSSQQLTRDDTASSTTPPPAPPASNTEVVVAAAKGGEAMAQSAADGSVPSPGIGHHKMPQ